MAGANTETRKQEYAKVLFWNAGGLTTLKLSILSELSRKAAFPAVMAVAENKKPGGQ